MKIHTCQKDLNYFKNNLSGASLVVWKSINHTSIPHPKGETAQRLKDLLGDFATQDGG